LSAQHYQLGDPSHHHQGLFLGDSIGNRFTLVLRNLKLRDNDDAELAKHIRLWSERGFINYFGKQRFGTSTVGTHLVGRALIAREWQEVINLILKPRSGENAHLEQLRLGYADTKNAEEVLFFFHVPSAVFFWRKCPKQTP